jgi:hypothetical protein
MDHIGKCQHKEIGLGNSHQVTFLFIYYSIQLLHRLNLIKNNNMSSRIAQSSWTTSYKVKVTNSNPPPPSLMYTCNNNNNNNNNKMIEIYKQKKNGNNNFLYVV